MEFKLNRYNPFRKKAVHTRGLFMIMHQVLNSNIISSDKPVKSNSFTYKIGPQCFLCSFKLVKSSSSSSPT